MGRANSPSGSSTRTQLLDGAMNNKHCVTYQRYGSEQTSNQLQREGK